MCKEPAYLSIRKKNMRIKLTDFILNTVLEDYISYESLNDLRFFTLQEADEYGGINGAFCGFFGLGDWFKNSMNDCEFDVNEFYDEYAKEIENRSLA